MWMPVVYTALRAATALLIPVAPWLFPAVLGCSILWFVTPAALTAWRSADISGLATGTWWLLVVDGLVVPGQNLPWRPLPLANACTPEAILRAIEDMRARAREQLVSAAE